MAGIQQHAMSDVRLIFIDGIQMNGLLTWNEGGVDEDAIEVHEARGITAQIGTGMEKLSVIEASFLVKRDSDTLLYHLEWRNSGKEARDITVYFTDKSGKIENAYRRDNYASCELLKFKDPAFDQAGRTKAVLNVSYAPYDWSVQLL